MTEPQNHKGGSDASGEIRPRVLVVSQPYPFPTVDGFTVRVADECTALAAECDLHLLVTREPRTEWPESAVFQSVTRVPEEHLSPGTRLLDRLARRVVRPHFDDTVYLPEAVRTAVADLDRRHHFDACIVHTPAWAGVFEALSPGVLRVIDAHDIWHRKYLAFQAMGKGRLLEHFRDPERELAAYRAADCTLAISTADHEVLARGGVESLLHVPVSFPLRDLPAPPDEPTLLYAASSGETNLDAIEACVTEILPAVRKEIPDARLLLMGGGQVVREKYGETDGVEVLPFLDDVDDAYARARVVIVPLRQGTGLKIKVLESLCRGIPTILTPVAAEGIQLENYAQETFPAGGEAFAKEVVRALEDDGYRAALTESGRAVIEAHYQPKTVYAELLTLLRERAVENDLALAPEVAV